MIDSVIIAGVFALLLSYVATAAVIRFGPLIGVLDDPASSRSPARLHDRPTPRGGGLALFIAVAATSWVFLPQGPMLIAITAGALIVTMVGHLDDRGASIHPYWRLITQFVAAGTVVGGLAGTGALSVPTMVEAHIGGDALALSLLVCVLSVLWVVFAMNATSWSSGVDGQLSGLVVIAALVVALKAASGAATPHAVFVAMLAAITGGAYLGFVPWHVYPQKIMPGFGGGTLAGFLLATLALLGVAEVWTLALVLAVPLVDAVWTVVRRLLRGSNPVWGDNGHLHHRLLAIGWSRNEVAIFYWGVTASLGAIVLIAPAPPLLLATAIGVALAAAALVLRMKEAAVSDDVAADSPQLNGSAGPADRDAKAGLAGNPRPAGPVEVWQTRVRARIVADVLSEKITADQACDRFGLRQEQLEDWKTLYAARSKRSQP